MSWAVRSDEFGETSSEFGETSYKVLILGTGNSFLTFTLTIKVLFLLNSAALRFFFPGLKSRVTKVVVPTKLAPFGVVLCVKKTFCTEIVQGTRLVG